MFKRTIWFSIGFVTGAGTAAYVYSMVREARGKVVADGMADTITDVARRVGTSVTEAFAEGRDAMRDAEARIAADLDLA